MKKRNSPSLPPYHIIFGCLLLTLFFVYKSSQVPSNPNRPQIKTQLFHNVERKWSLRSNPPPMNLSKLPPKNKLYVMILDDEYEAKPHQCIMKKQWVNEFLENPIVDGVEIYSTNYWTNKNCNLSSITINEMPAQKINPSAFLLFKSLELFLNRTDAGWLYIVGDAAYIQVQRFFNYFNRVTSSQNPEAQIFMVGSCVEERYFFQMLLANSGIVLSRNFVNKIISTRDDRIWNVSFSVGITAEEVLAKVSDKLGVYVPGKQNQEFLGRGWQTPEMYKMLLDKNYSSLPVCKIPHEYLRPPAGELGLCAAQIYQVNTIIVWAGTRYMSKEQFLNTAEEMLEDIDSNVAYYWDRIYPTLCLKEPMS